MILEKNSLMITSDESYRYKIIDFKDLKIYNNLYKKTLSKIVTNKNILNFLRLYVKIKWR